MKTTTPNAARLSFCVLWLLAQALPAQDPASDNCFLKTCAEETIRIPGTDGLPVTKPEKTNTPSKAAGIFFAACKSMDLAALENVVSQRQQDSLKKKGMTLAGFAEAWAKYDVVSIDGSDPPTVTLDGRATTKVNITLATASGKEPAKVTFSIEQDEWKMDED